MKKNSLKFSIKESLANMGEIYRYLILKEQIKRFTRRLVERQFSQISVMILDIYRKRLAKRRQVTGYRLVLHEIVDFFKLDIPFKAIIYPRII